MAVSCDIAVLGATCSGFAAAYHLARKGCSVVVVGAPGRAVECPLTDWVPGDFFRRKGLPKSLASASGAKPFRRVCYHSADMTRQAEHHSRSVEGYLVATADLAKALRAAAVKAGARVRTTKTHPAIRLDEEFVHLLGTSQVKARLLIVAQGSPDEALAHLSLPAPGVPSSSFLVAGLDIPLPKGCDGGAFAGALHVLQSVDRTELGMFFFAGRVAHVRVISNSLAGGARAAELSAMVGTLQGAGILPSDLPLSRARGAVWHPPAGVALEMDSHVAKRCLLAGTAGGFADSVTAQVSAPSVHSAILAADVAASALDSANVQDSLMRFKDSWRDRLADSLRPPNASPQMLLPLLFVNKRIVGKFTRAILHGESI